MVSGKWTDKHMALTPAYRYREEKDPTMKRTALLENNRLYIVSTGESLRIDDADTLTDIMFDKGLLVFMDCLENLPYLDHYVRDPYSEVRCKNKSTPGGRISFIKIKRGVRVCCISDIANWGPGKIDSYQYISDIDLLFEHMGVGRTVSPAGLGIKFRAKMWNENDPYRRHGTPNGGCDIFLRKNLYGPRIQMIGKVGHYDKVVYADITSAWPSKYHNLPTGTSLFGYGENGLKPFYKEGANFFAECKVTIPSELPLGPFPVRKNEYKLVYPTKPGTYKTAMWKEGVISARVAGCDVELGEGWGWDHSTDDTLPFVQGVYDKRITAPSEEVEELVKKVSVSTIGVEGATGSRYTLVLDEDPREGEELWNTSTEYGPVYTGYKIVETINRNPPGMIHWYLHTLSETSRMLYDEMFPSAILGKLISCYTDGYIAEESMYTSYKPKRKGGKMGEWTSEMLTDFEISSHGTFRSNERERNQRRYA